MMGAVCTKPQGELEGAGERPFWEAEAAVGWGSLQGPRAPSQRVADGFEGGSTCPELWETQWREGGKRVKG